MTANMKKVKISERKMQRASKLFEDLGESNTGSRTRSLAFSDALDKELDSILRRGGEVKAFVPPRSVKDPEPQDSLLLSLLDEELENEKGASASKKFKTKDSEEGNTVLEQGALMKLKELIDFCIKQSCKPLTAESLREKERGVRMTMEEAERHLFRCLCDSKEPKSICTLCSNMRLIGGTQIYRAWYDLTAAPSLDVDRVQHQYRLAVWKLGRYNDSVLTLGNTVYELVRWHAEESGGCESFLASVFRGKAELASRHCVLMVTQVVKGQKGCELELTDGRYCIKSQPLTFESNTNESLIATLIKEDKIKECTKLHIVNAKLSGKFSGSSHIQIMKNARLEIPYNGLSRALESARLGLQRKGWLYKGVDSLSQHGGAVQMLDVILLSKSTTKAKGGKHKAHFVDALSAANPAKARAKAEVVLANGEQCDRMEEGRRYKVFGVATAKAPLGKRSGVLYLKATDKCRIVEVKSSQVVSS